MKSIFAILFMLFINFGFTQILSLYNQFNGRFDFTFIGNTMNPEENTYQLTPMIFTSSSATLSLSSSDVIESAYLYWAGSGTGDFNVTLNATNITADRTFAFQKIVDTETFNYFSAFKNITSLVQTTGNGNYTLSNLDVTAFIDQHFQIKTNFAGWAIIIVYKNPTLPLNQLNIYDGLGAVPDEITINLNSLNVIDNTDAKIGFVAWEGDAFLAVNETLSVNGNILSNPPLNPANNVFNGTSSVTNTSDLYNMDLDIYNIQNTIAIGDTTAQIKLTSGQDFVMINAIVTKLNSQLPDATIVLNDYIKECKTKKITLNYTVFNSNSTAILPTATPIAIYANGILVGQTFTTTSIPIDGSQIGQINITLPDAIIAPYSIKLVVDDTGTGNGVVIELLENNNSFTELIVPYIIPKFNLLEPLFSCNQELTKGTFDFLNYNQLVIDNPSTDQFVGYYESFLDAQNETNPILNTSNYVTTLTPKLIYIKIKNANCNEITSFELKTRNCPVTIYNFVSANNDGTNDAFFIKGLRNIFLNFELQIYNRWGQLVWIGNNEKPDWDGEINKGLKLDSKKAPDSTYFYILYLNDPDYPNPLNGYLYLMGNN